MTAPETVPNWHGGWLAAVIPARARRFRVADPEVAPILLSCGGELVDDDADVEIAPVHEVQGDAPFAVVRFGPWMADGSDTLLPRVGRRLRAYLQVRSGVSRARRALSKQGLRRTVVVTWDIEQRLRHLAPRPRTWRAQPRASVAELLPGAALVVACRTTRVPSVLDHAAQSAASAVGEQRLELGCPMVRASGVLVGLSDHLVLKVALGPGRREIESHCAGLELLASADPAPAVSERVPRLYARGEAGLAYWSLESKLEGNQPSALSDWLVADCLDFLVALHACTRSAAARRSLVASAAVVAEFCERDHAHALIALAGQLEHELAGIPRGGGHGDFWTGNMLAQGGRLRGVVDWAAATEAQLPLTDLFNLLVAERASRYFGRALITFLLPWARAGGDDISRAYCQRLCLQIGPDRLEQLAIAWWLERITRELETYGDRAHRPAWLHENVEFVVDALRARAD